MLWCRAAGAFTDTRCYNTEHHCWWEWKMVQRVHMPAFYRAKHRPTIGACPTTSRDYPREIKIYICRNPHIQMFIAALFRVAKTGEQVYPSSDRLLDKQTAVHPWHRPALGGENQQSLIRAHRWISSVLCRADTLHGIQVWLYDVLQKQNLRDNTSLAVEVWELDEGQLEECESWQTCFELFLWHQLHNPRYLLKPRLCNKKSGI